MTALTPEQREATQKLIEMVAKGDAACLLTRSVDWPSVAYNFARYALDQTAKLEAALSALRRLAIIQRVHIVAAGAPVHSGYWCKACDAETPDDKQGLANLRHAETCLLNSTPSASAPAKTADEAFEEAAAVAERFVARGNPGNLIAGQIRALKSPAATRKD